jgi:hypothetical protein
MGMMQIIISHYIQSYDKVSHKPLMLIKAKVLGKVKKGKCGQQKVGYQTSLKPIQHHGG